MLFQAQESLMITVHEAKGLPGGDLPDPPDPYVKLYLLADKTGKRDKKSKRKTDVEKDTVTPIYEKDFEYENLPLAKLQQNLKLEVTVVDNKGIFSRSSNMGRTEIDLSDIPQNRISNVWFDLSEIVEEDSD